MNSPSADKKKIVLALTGASGAVYGLRTLQALAQSGAEVWLSISPAGGEIVRRETGIEIDLGNPAINRLCPKGGESVRYVPYNRLDAPVCSGSFLFDAMAIVPCSMRTLGAVASGCGDNTIHRAADVALKERRRLVLVPREAPLSAIHLRNMLELARAGAVVLPASPGFYHRPDGVDALVDFIVSRILDALGIDNTLAPRWPEK